MEIEVYDQHLLKVAVSNPNMVASILLDWAFVRANGEPDAETAVGDGIHTHPFFAFDHLVAACGSQLAPGGALVPSFLRDLAKAIELAQEAKVKEFMTTYPTMLDCIPETFQQWVKSGYPSAVVSLVTDRDATEQWRRLLEGENRETPFLKT